MNDMPSDPLFGLSQRLPPGNAQAEQALLGALLANNRAFEHVGDYLRGEHFHDPVHGRIYDAVARRIAAGQLADPVTLRGEFEQSAILDNVGGLAYLAQLLNAMVGIVNAGNYGRVIVDAWQRRELIEMCAVTIERAFAPADRTALDIVEEVEGTLTRLVEGAGEVRAAVPAAEAVKAAVAASLEAGHRESALAGISTGYDALDRMTGGLMPGKMYLVGARPGMGKSGLALGIAARAASAGVPTLMWSGEMAARELGTRLAAAHAGLNVQSVFRGKGWVMPENPYPGQKAHLEMLKPAAWDALVRSEREAEQLPLVFDDRSGISISALRSRARALKRKGKLGFLVVDYIGLMRATREMLKRDLREQTTELSRDLLALLDELQVPGLVLSQLSRANERRESKMPQQSDLRDSGALEQDAYAIMFIHRPHYYLMQDGEPVRSAKESSDAHEERVAVWREMVAQTTRTALINVAKNRGGPTGITRLRFDGATIWFRDEHESDSSRAWGGSLL